MNLTHVDSTTFLATRARKPAGELSLAAFKNDFCSARMLSNVVWSSFGAGWFERAAAGKLGDLSQKATKALARSSFGRLEHMEDLELQGAADYGDCLRVMAAELEGKSPVDARDLIVPILLLLTTSLNYPYRPYESFLAQQEEQASKLQPSSSTSPPSPNSDLEAVRSHIRGLGALVYCCGPKAFSHEPWTSIFDCTRANLVLIS